MKQNARCLPTDNALGAPAWTLGPLICAEIEFFMKACQSWWSEASPRHTITSQSEGFVLESESCSLIHQEGWHPQVDPPWRMSWGYSPPGEMQSSCATLGDNNATDTHALT